MTHNDGIKVTLLISTYNWREALSLCLKAVSMQTRMPDEIVIADDGSRDDTREVIDRFRQSCRVPVIHCWQEDKGFRKTRILNYAIAQSAGGYIIQIDGDIVIDRHFIADHLSQMRPHTFFERKPSRTARRVYPAGAFRGANRFYSLFATFAQSLQCVALTHIGFLPVSPFGRCASCKRM